MSVAACGGGSDDDKGGDEKKMRKGLAQILDLLPLNDEDENDDDQTEEDDEIAKPKKTTILHRLASRGASYSAKRGLSRYYMGKSTSFENLMKMGIKDVKELGKKEHPLNQKRRLSIANENRGKSPLSKMSRAASVPNFLPKNEGDDDDDDGSSKDDKVEKKGKDNYDSKNQDDGN